MKRDYSFFFKHPFFESCKSLLQKLYYYLLETRDKGQGTRDKGQGTRQHGLVSLYTVVFFSLVKNFFVKKCVMKKQKKTLFFKRDNTKWEM